MCKALVLKRVSYGLVTVVLGCTALAGDYERRPVSPDELRRQYTQEELLDRRQAEQVDLARQTTRSLHARAVKAQELIATLKGQTESFISRMQTLLQSDEGKRIARDPVGARVYQGLRDYPTVTLTEITERADAASALVDRLASLQSGPEANFVPTQETQDQVHRLYFWVLDRLDEIEVDIASLNNIIREAPTDFDTTNSKTLQVILDEIDAALPRLLAEYRMLGERRAARDVKEIVVDAAYFRRLERARAEEHIRKKEMDAEVARRKAQVEAAASDEMAAAKRQLFDAEKRYDDAVAEIERLRKQAQVERQVADSDASIQRDTQLTEAERRRKIALAKSPEVAQLLAPFITPGYWQPGRPVPSYEKQPMSLALITERGALEPSPKGLQELLEIAIYPNDKVRPRWGFRSRLRYLSEAQHQTLLQAQKYLIDCGPILVELGMLSK